MICFWIQRIVGSFFCFIEMAETAVGDAANAADPQFGVAVKAEPKLRTLRV